MSRAIHFFHWLLHEAGVAQHESSWPVQQASITHYGTGKKR